MKRAALVALATATMLLAVDAATAGGATEPVSITAEAPEKATVGTPFKIEVQVAAEAGTLAIAAQPLRAHVKLAPECGGSFVGTNGQTALDQQLPAPGSGAYAQTVSAMVTPAAAGTVVVCAFLDRARHFLHWR